MKKEYDFSKAVRGKFFRPAVELGLPIYLEKENLEFIASLAKRKRVDPSTVVNGLIRGDRELAKAIQ